MAEVRAKKALGQHFLTDLNIARKIATALSGGTADAPDKVGGWMWYGCVDPVPAPAQ